MEQRQRHRRNEHYEPNRRHRRRSPERAPRRRRRMSSSSLSSTDSEYLETASWAVGRSRTRSPHPWLKQFAGSRNPRRGAERDNEKQLVWDGFQWVTKSNIISANIDEVVEANRRARLVAISNVPVEYNVSEYDLRHFLNKKMQEFSLADAAESAILRVWKDEENSKIFIAEFSSQDAAKNGAKLDGLKLLGRPLKLGTFAEVEGVAKIGQSLGIDTQVLYALDNVHASATAAATAVAAIQDLQSGVDRAILADFEFEHPLSKVVKVFGFKDPRQCRKLPHHEFREIESDMKSEFSSYGQVVYCHMVRENEGKLGAEVGSVFIEFATPEAAQSATHRMSGKKFDRKTIRIVEIPDELFHAELKCK